MRKNLLKTIMPAIAIVFAVAAAFATQAQDSSTADLRDAYIPMAPGQSCQSTPIQCDAEVKDNICTYQGQQAFGLADDDNLTSCSVILYKE